jgi:hypothetical protein
MLALVSAVALSFTTVQNGCHSVAMWEHVNVPVAPAIESTEVLRGTAVFDASSFLGMLLTTRNERIYFSSAVSDDPSALRRGTVTPVSPKRVLLLKSYTTVDCFSTR